MLIREGEIFFLVEKNFFLPVNERKFTFWFNEAVKNHQLDSGDEIEREIPVFKASGEERREI
jgi:hypothetical protein